MRYRENLTTGNVAKICEVAPRTVSKWFDSGALKGYRIPGSQDRRIPRVNLIAFMKEHGFDASELESECYYTVLLVGDVSMKEPLQQKLKSKFRVEHAGTIFEAGMAVKTLKPECVIADFCVGRFDALNMLRTTITLPGSPKVLTIALAMDDETQMITLSDWIGLILKRPYRISEVVEAIKADQQSKVGDE